MNRFPVFLLLTLCILAVVHPTTAETITVPIGDILPLSGYAPGADSVYLFLTGPNLPSNGVKLDDISIPVVTGDPSTFVETLVEADGYWEYDWNTHTKGGTLDSGTYTVYIITTPVGRRDLTLDESYTTLSVSLTQPTLTILPGGITIRTEPSGAEVWVDGTLQGTTPLDLPRIIEGNHSIEIKKEGYESSVTNVTVAGGENTIVEETLVLKTIPATLAETGSIYPTAQIPFPISAVILGLGIVIAVLRMR